MLSVNQRNKPGSGYIIKSWRILENYSNDYLSKAGLGKENTL